MTVRRDDLKRNILQQYVRNIVCIDDDYQDVYNGSTPNEMEQQLYRGLVNETGAFITMLKYDNNVDTCARFAEKADMTILDWELEEDTIGDSFCHTLYILERILKSRNSLICIYTQIGDEKQVYDQVQIYFSGVTKKRLDDIRKRLLLEDFECEEWIEAIKKLLDEGDGTEEILHRIETARKGMIEKEDTISTNEILEYMKYWIISERYHALFPERETERYEITRLHHDHNITGINIGGKLLTVFHKMENREGEKLDNPVKPAELFERFAEVIELAPNSFFNVVWMAYQNMVRESVCKNSLFLNTVPDKILRYLRKSRGDTFLDELKDHFSQELIFRLNETRFEDETELLHIIDSIPEENADDEEIIEFNAFYSQYRYAKKDNEKICFGDMFIVQMRQDKENVEISDDISGRIVVCITAKCDCAHGKETTKTRNCYSFAIRTADKVTKIPNNPESSEEGLYEFIRKKDGKAQIVKWDDNFIKLFIKEPVINKDKVDSVVYKNCECELEYIGTLKENYTQRIANRLFSYATRVGITYLSKQKKN